ncbi:MAG: hypothetical protein ABMB14_09110, partial [Myxococcota bacterium]
MWTVGVVVRLGLGIASGASPRPGSVSLGPGGSASVVDVPLIRGEGDPRPRVEARLAEQSPPVLAVID